MEPGTVAVIIAGMALITTIGINVISGSWKLRGELSNMKSELTTAIGLAKDDIEQRQDNSMRQYSETFSALRQKINDVELDSAKTYMRRDSFYKSVEEIKADFRTAFEKIDRSLERLEKKVDQA